MTNKEKYLEKIADIAIESGCVALVNGIPTMCDDTPCKDCDIGDKEREVCCGNEAYGNKMKDWLDAEYVEPTIDWSKVDVDTPILVRDFEDKLWNKAHFAKYECGKVYTFYCGGTSWTNDADHVTTWKYAKLAESEEK